MPLSHAAWIVLLAAAQPLPRPAFAEGPALVDPLLSTVKIKPGQEDFRRGKSLAEDELIFFNASEFTTVKAYLDARRGKGLPDWRGMQVRRATLPAGPALVLYDEAKDEYWTVPLARQDESAKSGPMKKVFFKEKEGKRVVVTQDVLGTGKLGPEVENPAELRDAVSDINVKLDPSELGSPYGYSLVKLGGQGKTVTPVKTLSLPAKDEPAELDDAELSQIIYPSQAPGRLFIGGKEFLREIVPGDPGKPKRPRWKAKDGEIIDRVRVEGGELHAMRGKQFYKLPPGPKGAPLARFDLNRPLSIEDAAMRPSRTSTPLSGVKVDTWIQQAPGEGNEGSFLRGSRRYQSIDSEGRRLEYDGQRWQVIDDRHTLYKHDGKLYRLVQDGTSWELFGEITGTPSLPPADRVGEKGLTYSGGPINHQWISGKSGGLEFEINPAGALIWNGKMVTAEKMGVVDLQIARNNGAKLPELPVEGIPPPRQPNPGSPKEEPLTFEERINKLKDLGALKNVEKDANIYLGAIAKIKDDFAQISPEEAKSGLALLKTHLENQDDIRLRMAAVQLFPLLFKRSGENPALGFNLLLHRLADDKSVGIHNYSIGSLVEMAPLLKDLDFEAAEIFVERLQAQENKFNRPKMRPGLLAELQAEVRKASKPKPQPITRLRALDSLDTPEKLRGAIDDLRKEWQKLPEPEAEKLLDLMLEEYETTRSAAVQAATLELLSTVLDRAPGEKREKAFGFLLAEQNSPDSKEIRGKARAELLKLLPTLPPMAPEVWIEVTTALDAQAKERKEDITALQAAVKKKAAGDKMSVAILLKEIILNKEKQTGKALADQKEAADALASRLPYLDAKEKESLKKAFEDLMLAFMSNSDTDLDQTFRTLVGFIAVEDPGKFTETTQRRYAMADYIARSGKSSDEAIKAMGSWFDDKETSVYTKERIIAALSRVAPETLPPHLLKLLADPKTDAVVREPAAKALLSISPRTAFASIEYPKTGKDPLDAKQADAAMITLLATHRLNFTALTVGLDEKARAAVWDEYVRSAPVQGPSNTARKYREWLAVNLYQSLEESARKGIEAPTGPRLQYYDKVTEKGDGLTVSETVDRGAMLRAVRKRATQIAEDREKK